ncbi:MAG: GH92 family glycosyl hydrolase [Prolixibacteraceae bacterium]|jgi:predicted alpha-1,2-mannosidase|nr:GH92 family glycosyl hydrolase [Prolixibacteraceae bacterium]
MKVLSYIVIILTLFLTSFQVWSAEKSPIRYVNPLIGSGGNGNVSPIAGVPFGMAQVGPDTNTGGSGYRYTDNQILGFSHFHKSGGGCSDFLDILFQPVPGFLWKGSAVYPANGFAFVFSHSQEHAVPGNYNVTLDQSKVNVSITATSRCAFHHYTFPKPGINHVTIDLKHGATGGCTIVPKDNYDTVKISSLRIVDDHTIEGCRVSEGQAKEAHGYFYAMFSKPFTTTALYKNRQIIDKALFLEGIDIRSILTFQMKDKNDLYVKVGLSTVSTEGAKRNLTKEIPGWNFNEVKTQAQREWNKELSKISIEDKNEKRKEIFYTSLYYTKMYPMLSSDVDGQYRGPDHQVHIAEGFNYYGGHIGFWDTYRAAYPLLTVTNPDVANDLVKTCLAFFSDCRQLPILVVAGNETYQMTGLHVMPFIADCYRKGIRNYDADAVFEAMKSTAMRDTTGFSMRYFTGLKNYKKYGYIPAELEVESVARTLDYAYDDWCIAQMAKMLGKEQDYDYFLKRSTSYRNVFDPSIGLMRGRFADGTWRTPFDPFASSHRRDDFCEGNSWQWSFSVAHDVKGLSQLMGGNKKLIAKLDTFFHLSSKITGENASTDISGMIGQYAHGNEPGHHTIYMYSYLGQPWKTQQYVHQVLTTLYDNTPDGICGNEDTGQMSAWYVLSSMGFYPVRHGDGTYVIGSPSYKKVRINLPNGKHLILKTNNLSDANIYIQSMKMNGNQYSKNYFQHDELTRGGEIIFEMGMEPNACWGTDDADFPPSMFDELKQDKLTL